MVLLSPCFSSENFASLKVAPFSAYGLLFIFDFYVVLCVQIICLFPVFSFIYDRAQSRSFLRWFCLPNLSFNAHGTVKFVIICNYFLKKLL